MTVLIRTNDFTHKIYEFSKKNLVAKDKIIIVGSDSKVAGLYRFNMVEVHRGQKYQAARFEAQ